MRRVCMVGLLLFVLPAFFLAGCASYYPYALQEFKDADMAIKEAEKVGPPQVDPANVEAAKAKVKEAYDVYRVCRTEQAKKILAEAIALANKRGMANQGPVAIINGPVSVAVEEIAYYSGEKSYDPEKSALVYAWDFGDGATSQGAVASHSWAKPGMYEVKLTVTDEGGLSDTAKLMVNVGAPEKKFISLSNTVLFDFDKSNIKPPAKVILDDIADMMKKDPALKATLGGNTDWIGTEQYNMGLSKRRAYAVYNYLVKKGIDKSRFNVKWYGETRPVADNRTAAGRARNRRTDITLEK